MAERVKRETTVHTFRIPVVDGGRSVLNQESGRRLSLARVILRDAHFWIPVAVLLGGLAVLRWIN